MSKFLASFKNVIGWPGFGGDVCGFSLTLVLIKAENWYGKTP